MQCFIWNEYSVTHLRVRWKNFFKCYTTDFDTLHDMFSSAWNLEGTQGSLDGRLRLYVRLSAIAQWHESKDSFACSLPTVLHKSIHASTHLNCEIRPQLQFCILKAIHSSCFYFKMLLCYFLLSLFGKISDILQCFHHY